MLSCWATEEGIRKEMVCLLRNAQQDMGVLSPKSIRNKSGNLVEKNPLEIGKAKGKYMKKCSNLLVVRQITSNHIDTRSTKV